MGKRGHDLGRSAHLLQGCWYNKVCLPGDVKKGVRPQETDLVLKGFEVTLSLGKLRKKEEGKSSVLEPNARTCKCWQW